MFKDQQVFGVLLGIALLVGLVLMAVRATKGLIEKDKIMFLMVMLVSMLAGVWVVDKIIAFKTHLLDPEENKFIMETMKSIILLIIGRGSTQVTVTKKSEDK